MKVLCCLVLVLFCHQVFSYGHYGKGKLMKSEGKVIRIDVKEVKVTYNSQGIQEEKLMKVDLKITYKDGRVMVNGIPVLPSSVLSFQTQATVVDITPQNNEINKRSSPVLVRVLVNRRFYRKGWRKSSRLFLEEQIISVDGNKVDQINIKEMILELGCRGNKNIYYKLNDKKPEESEIHHRNPNNDNKPDKDHHHPDIDKDHPESFPEGAINAFKRLPIAARIAIYTGCGIVGLLIVFGLYKLCCRSTPRRSTEQTYVDNVKLVYNPNMEGEKPDKPEKVEKKPEVKQAFEEVVVA